MLRHKIRPNWRLAIVSIDWSILYSIQFRINSQFAARTNPNEWLTDNRDEKEEKFRKKMGFLLLFHRVQGNHSASDSMRSHHTILFQLDVRFSFATYFTFDVFSFHTSNHFSASLCLWFCASVWTITSQNYWTHERNCFCFHINLIVMCRRCRLAKQKSKKKILFLFLATLFKCEFRSTMRRTLLYCVFVFIVFGE